MQGQECEAVIVSYGVSDVGYAMNEKEFIYSLNRLNVAITRARSKTIVFLPRCSKRSGHRGVQRSARTDAERSITGPSVGQSASRVAPTNTLV
jgi:AAA domain-containing protein